MNISVIGAGYVGLVCGAGFSEMGNNVICVDVDADKIALLSTGVSPIYEPGLGEMIVENLKTGALTFTTDIAEALRRSDICVIAVGTPMNENGSADLRHALAAADSVGRYMDKHMYVVVKSTVPVGSSEKIRAAVKNRLAERGSNLTFDVISNPEFLKEGMAIGDFVKPDRIVVGVDNEAALDVMRELYAPFTKNHDNLIAMDIASAEMTKYAANAMLATRISFMNEVANICERVGADVNKVRVGIGSDSRIGYHFLYAGCGYGGSCFPKDVRAIISTADEHGYMPHLLKAVEEVNLRQKEIVAEKVERRFCGNLRDRVIAVWGLAFKPGTDDMRESPAIAIINRLVSGGALIRAYDPKAVDIARNHHFRGHTSIEYFDSKYAAIKGADALLLLTEWKEFRSPDFGEMLKLMRLPVIFDGRNQYHHETICRLGFEYQQIGVRTPDPDPAAEKRPYRASERMYLSGKHDRTTKASAVRSVV